MKSVTFHDSLRFYVMGNLGHTGITQGGIDFLDLGASGQLPDQGMFPGPAANNQYLQCFPLPSM